MVSENPARYIKLLKENNIRDRVLSEEEFQRLLDHSPKHLKPIFIIAYYTGMRKSEIRNLTWDQVDLDGGFIKLNPEDTKTNEGRLVPLSKKVIEAIKQIVPVDGLEYLFTYQGKRTTHFRKAFYIACKKAGIEDFRFHDFRHCAITNWVRQGHNHFKIMAATGHKTVVVFQRYNTVSKEDLKSLVED